VHGKGDNDAHAHTRGPLMQPKNPEGSKPSPSPSPTPPDRVPNRKPDSADMDKQLDAELEQTFPASDPLPWTHRVD
jgi:hypothetical protein